MVYREVNISVFVPELERRTGTIVSRYQLRVKQLDEIQIPDNHSSDQDQNEKRRFSASLFWNLVPRTGLEPVSPIGHYHLKVACLPIPPPRHGYYFLVRDIAGRLSRSSWLSLFGFRRRTQVFPFATFIGFVAIDVTQHQTDDEE